MMLALYCYVEHERDISSLRSYHISQSYPLFFMIIWFPSSQMQNQQIQCYYFVMFHFVKQIFNQQIRHILIKLKILMSKNQQIIELSDYKVRGAGHVIRTIMEYLALPYKDHYLQYPKNIDVKLLYSSAYSLPHLKDGEIEIHGIIPIAKYLCRKAGRQDLLGKTPKDAAKIQELLIRKEQYKNSIIMEVLPKKQLIGENRSEIIKITFEEPTRKSLLDELNNMVSKNGWTFGYFTIIDFFIAEMGFKLSGFFPELLDKYHPFMVDLRKKFNEIDSIKSYFSSDRFVNGIGQFSTYVRWKGNPKDI